MVHVSRLADVQRWMHAAIARLPTDTQEAFSRDVLLPSARLSVEERLRVYQSAYLARLGECLRSEFPAVVAAVGDDVFNEFAVAYVERHPPASYTLGELGRHFPPFLAELRPARTDAAPDFGDFLIDLARYERIVAEVFDAEGPETDPLPPEQRLPVTDAATFAAGRIECYPCVHGLGCDFPVHEYRSAVRRDEAPAPPEPRGVHLLLSREKFIVRRWEIPAWQHALFDELQAGQTVGAALSAVGAVHGNELTPDGLQTVFREWTTRGVIRRWTGTAT